MSTETADPKTDEIDVSEPILDLDLVVGPAPTLRYEGTLYEFRRMDDFGIEDQQLLHRQGAEFDELWRKEALNKAQRQRLKLLLDQIFDKVLDAPRDIKNAFSDAQRQKVLLTFFLIPLAEAAEREQKEQETSQLTSENSSPDSTDSTAPRRRKTATG